MQSLTELTSPENDQTNYLEAYVGEGRKYKDAAELARAYANADIHIQELKAKLDEMNASGNVLKEVLDELRKPKPEITPVPTAEINVAEVVQSELAKAQENTRREANIRASLEMLIAHYGSESAAVAAIRTVVKNNTSVKKVIDDLSATNPDLLFNLITKQVEKAQDQLNTPGIDNSQSGSSVPLVGLTWSAAREFKKKDPKAYNSPAFRKQMEAMAAQYAAQGKDWFAT